MATYTPNHNLKKPSPEDFYNVADQNSNMDKIDLALASMVPKTQKGAAGGVAELDGSGKVPAAQLPAYVDDVLEYATLSAFPVTGEAGKIYVSQDSNKTYRWSGSAYTEISASLALGETSSTAYPGDKGKAAYDHSQATGNPHGTTATQVGAYTKEEALSATVKTEYGLPVNAVPDGVFQQLKNELFGLFGTKGIVKVALKKSDGTPMSGISVSCNTATAGKTYITDEQGIVFIDCNATQSTVSIPSDYVDLQGFSETISTPLNRVTSFEKTVAVLSQVKIASSQTVKISPYCKKLDVTVVGAGGGGQGGYGSNGASSAGDGGGGGYCNTVNNVSFTPNTNYSIVIGAGGKGGVPYVNQPTAGGFSSAFGINANGGSAGTGGSSGNGRGATGGNVSGGTIYAAVAGNTVGVDGITYGGGGGGGTLNQAGTNYNGGDSAGYGGTGGYRSGSGSNGAAGFGGGGGGGGGYYNNKDSYGGGTGGTGGSGCVVLRMEH